jgi:hypothetical protein
MERDMSPNPRSSAGIYTFTTAKNSEADRLVGKDDFLDDVSLSCLTRIAASLIVLGIRGIRAMS